MPTDILQPQFYENLAVVMSQRASGPLPGQGHWRVFFFFVLSLLLIVNYAQQLQKTKKETPPVDLNRQFFTPQEVRSCEIVLWPDLNFLDSPSCHVIQLLQLWLRRLHQPRVYRRFPLVARWRFNDALWLHGVTPWGKAVTSFDNRGKYFGYLVMGIFFNIKIYISEKTSKFNS